MASLVSLLAYPTPYVLYIDELVTSDEFCAGLEADSVTGWKILTRWIDNLPCRNKLRIITNVILTGALSTDADLYPC